MKDKIYYSENILFEIALPDTHKISVKKKDLISDDKVIARSNVQENGEVGAFSGKASVKVDERSKLDGMVVNIDKKPIKSDFGVVYQVDEVYGNAILTSIPGVVINLFDAKGKNCAGYFQFIESDHKKLDNAKGLDGKIVVVDTLLPDMYPKLITLGVTGIISGSVDYGLYSELQPENVPVCVFCGFGFLKFDKDVLGLFSKHSKVKIIVDVAYKRLIIPLENKPSFFIKEYNFEPPI